MNGALYYLSIEETSARIRAGDVSPIAVVDACLARIEALGSRLNAFITVLADEARDRAHEADTEIRAGRWRGPLHGIPIGVKDFYDTAGVRTTAAFEKFTDRIPAKDADVVAALKNAGAIVVGKTNMHRLGMGTTGLESAFGATANPWNDAYIPGGSSSGSAAAVAAGLCYATIDTDAIGSCRLPAACCGVDGFKGTYDAISAKGVLEGEPADPVIVWLAHPGITTRGAGDTARILETLVEPEARARVFGAPSAASQSQTPLRIGMADNAPGEDAVTRAFEAAVDTLRTLGHSIVSAAAPFDMPRFGDLHRIEADRAAIADRVFARVDLLVLPTLPTTVLPVKDARANPQSLSPAYTMFANYFGLPAISVPCGFDTRGLPVGMQIVGRPWGDAAVLRLAQEYERAATAARPHPIP